MEPKVFISHSTRDKAIADAICKTLESAGIRCWIAPRDIEPGADWTEGIMNGITGCRVFVLVFSAHANDSDHVRREVARAFSLGQAVIPFRTEAIVPRDSLVYFLETVQWLDATAPPLQPHLMVLTERVKHLLEDQKTQAAVTESIPEKQPGASKAAVPTQKRWLLPVGIAAAVALIAAGLWFFVANSRKPKESTSTAPDTAISAKSIAVLPFESISANKEDTYFADGVQDQILNDLAKIAQLTVISRTSVMQYRPDEKRDVRQIATALGVSNLLEGTVRRAGNRVRVSTELIDAHRDKTTWADSFDRELTDIFAIQSEVAETIADKLAATLSPEEKGHIEKKPTENLAAYDLYLQANELLVSARVNLNFGDIRKPLLDASALLNQAIRLDPKFTLAYCALAGAQSYLYQFYEPTEERRTSAEAALKSAQRLEPDLPEVHLAYARNLYQLDRDYERARVQLAIARQGLPNDAEAIMLEAYIDRRQGQFAKAIQEFNEALSRDPRNSVAVEELGNTLFYTRQFRDAGKAFDRLIELRPDEPMLQLQKPWFVTWYSTGDDNAIRAALAALPASMAGDRGALSLRLAFALVERDWQQAEDLIEKLNGGDDEGDFAYGQVNVPVGCYSILLARFKEKPADNSSGFADTREQLNQKVQKAPGNAPLLSQLAVVDVLLKNKEAAIAEAKHAIELLPIAKDAVWGPCVELNLAVVYAWTNELDLAFEKLNSLAAVPGSIYYGQLKSDVYWEPLRHDPRYQQLLAQLEPKD
jgi:TolB-like protein/Tfp pilus assembly protein PilF